tara:strand:- start:68 stop:1018 length:951 start_codon:yes stop_codon:yes gene_type:complete
MTVTAELRGMATAGLLAFVLVLLLVSVPTSLPGVELLQSLRFHLAALGIPLAIILFATRALWRGLLVVTFMLASAGQGMLPLLAGYEARAAVTGETLGEIEVLSFNVLSGRDGRAAADFIIAQAPDIAVIMETPGIERYLDAIAAVLPYRLGCDVRASCDISVFSRTPLQRASMYQMPPYFHERLAVVTTEIDGVPVTVAGMHLSKPYFDSAAWGELQYAHAVLKSLPGRVILAGDFNAAAWSDQIAGFTEALDLVPPPGHPATWPVKAGPLGVPIDNMFTRGPLLIEDIAALDDSYGSNHRALLARISLRAASSP